ncbi:hypothetical protein Tco_1571927, partial [Tanacetum coccineum]
MELATSKKLRLLSLDEDKQLFKSDDGTKHMAFVRLLIEERAPLGVALGGG